MIKKIATASILATMVALNPLTADAQSLLSSTKYPGELNQGQEIYSKEINSTCTLGYVDHENRLAYTAAHCGEDGETITTRDGKQIGVMEHLNDGKWNENGLFNVRYDSAVIHLNDDIVLGENLYSGDKMAPTDSIVAGAEACNYGKTKSIVMCGVITKVETGGVVVLSGGSLMLPGDSGGPAWIPGEGLIGVNSGRSHLDLMENNTQHSYIAPVTGYTNQADTSRLENTEDHDLGSVESLVNLSSEWRKQGSS